MSPRRACLPRLAPLFAGALIVCLEGCATIRAPEGDAVAVWTQLGRDGAQVRAIVEGEQACPEAEAGGVILRLRERAAPDDSAESKGNPSYRPPFAVRSCELDLPASPGAVRIAGQSLEAWPATLKRIVIVGDTGCRIKVAADGRGDPVQDCADPQVWPWARLARSAAATRPDLVVHLGDYHYREYCEDPVQCAPLAAKQVVIGYGWRGWQADFFDPAAPLLAAAPWVLVRGNHENCDRAGEGWMRFLAPGRYQPCPDQRVRSASRSQLGNNLTADAYVLELPGLSIGVVDNAAHEDYRPAAQTPEDAVVFKRTLPPLRSANQPAGPRWLLTHRPLWSDHIGPQSEPNVFQQAMTAAGLDGVEAIFSGHLHAFQTLNFAGGRPAQLVVGGGGTQLEARDPASPFYEGSVRGSREREQPTGRLYDGQAATSGLLLNRDGFLLLERRGAGWDGELRDPDGLVLRRCRLDDGSRQFACPMASVRP